MTVASQLRFYRIFAIATSIGLVLGFASAGLVALVAFVSPYRRDRNAVRHVIEQTLRLTTFLRRWHGNS